MLQISGLKKSFAGLPILAGLDLTVKDGEIVALLGPSGCGKTTLLNLISGLCKADGGTVRRDSDVIGYVFQDDRLLPWYTVYNNIRLAREQKEAAEDEICPLLRMVELEEFKDYYPAQLSGGMCKRCGIARAFYSQSRLLLLDEPFQALDVRLRAEMRQLLLAVWQKTRQAMLFVTHDIEEALDIAHRIVVLSPRPAAAVGEFAIPACINEAQRGPIRQEIKAMLQMEESA